MRQSNEGSEWTEYIFRKIQASRVNAADSCVRSSSVPQYKRDNVPSYHITHKIIFLPAF